MTKPLRPYDIRALKDASGKRPVFAGRRESTFDSLERRGLLKSELRAHTMRPTTTEFRRAYTITDAGRKALADATGER